MLGGNRSVCSSPRKWKVTLEALLELSLYSTAAQTEVAEEVSHHSRLLCTFHFNFSPTT